MFRWSRLVRLAVPGAAVAMVTAGLAWPALADPATSVNYRNQASVTRFGGLAFDTCSAPSQAAMQAWAASPYRGIGVYVGGVNRTCKQPNLTSAWVSAVSGRWMLLPVYKGLQAPCGGKATDQKITPTAAASQGKSEADQATADVSALGMIKGSAIYFDMESYTTTDAACRTTVLTFLSAWTRELHRLGYAAGVYENLNLGARDLAGVYTSASYARPDALWIARYDASPSLSGWAGIADTMWAVHQRAKQYRAEVPQTYSGVTITIDIDNVDAPSATLAHAYRVTSADALTARSGPAVSYPAVTSYPAGASLTVVCQAPGSTVRTTSVWDKLINGTYVSDYYVSTPSNTGYSQPLAPCRYAYQVTAATAAKVRSGPGASYAVTGSLPAGALAWVSCQRAGSKVGGTRIWDKISYQHWVSDYYVATASTTSYSKPVPRC
jgi:uncharacterized protein YraI